MAATTQIQDLYKELLAALADGERAAVVSAYGPDGATEKTVVRASDAEGWGGVERLASFEGAVTDGPLTHVPADGGLTVIERYLPKPRLVILGGGHIALALSQMAKLAEFSVLVFDDRPAFASKERFPFADEVIMDDFTKLFERVKIRETDYVCIVTRGHKHDQECLEGVLKGTEPAYTGMIGSRRRVAIVMKQLEDAGYDRAALDLVHTPIGLKIGAVTPAEISVSILAEIISVFRAKNNLTCDIETAEALAAGGAGMDALLTILETHGSVPRETGAKMAMTYEGRILGTIGGGCAESDVMHDARTVIREGGWRLKTVDMTGTAEEDGMVCGGQMQVLIERI
ncbi:MAG: XdhC family protein [Clostridiales Family XIII bacterium]|jgi:xanthine dehydrogenase accessory factor|nr:XdhC family protein [Clostridiales Family XIII bacterium]